MLLVKVTMLQEMVDFLQIKLLYARNNRVY